MRQLFPADKMGIDYDQFLDKRPGKEKAIFAWHQDMACESCALLQESASVPAKLWRRVPQSPATMDMPPALTVMRRLAAGFLHA
jgi:hypothetical protein